MFNRKQTPMEPEERWHEEPDGGTTSGSDEALRREIEKSKALKVERLQLRNKIDSLQNQNDRLLEENCGLRTDIENLRESVGEKNHIDSPKIISTIISSIALSARDVFLPILVFVFVICLFFYYTLTH